MVRCACMPEIVQVESFWLACAISQLYADYSIPALSGWGWLPILSLHISLLPVLLSYIIAERFGMNELP